jgi:hypothetical protein
MEARRDSARRSERLMHDAPDGVNRGPESTRRADHGDQRTASFTNQRMVLRGRSVVTSLMTTKLDRPHDR